MGCIQSCYQDNAKLYSPMNGEFKGERKKRGKTNGLMIKFFLTELGRPQGKIAGSSSSGMASFAAHHNLKLKGQTTP